MLGNQGLTPLGEDPRHVGAMLWPTAEWSETRPVTWADLKGSSFVSGAHEINQLWIGIKILQP